MASQTAVSAPVPHPTVGSVVADGTLRLVEVLGVGGYGVCYKAIDTLCYPPRTVAVKCLIQTQSHHSRQSHLREITLHQLASAHPNVVSLHRVIQEGDYTFIVMEYAADGDLFSQILNSRRYLGNDALVRHVFLQLLDAVDYCHRLGIYHRDLKPENVLCFDGGHHVALTDFGLATTTKSSTEFRTGSVYHMSPECQSGEWGNTGSYSPMSNDVWSLAIVLLNLTTGRNPWKAATLSDPTFQAYVNDPLGFIPTVLPISLEMNILLTHMLALDWRDRPSVAEVRMCVEGIETFYSSDAVFEDSMARCPWESHQDFDEEVVYCEVDEAPLATKQPTPPSPNAFTSQWSDSSGSDSDMVFADHTISYGDARLNKGDSSWPYDPVYRPPICRQDSATDENYATPPFVHSLSSNSGSDGFPLTPNSCRTVFDTGVPLKQQKLVINTSKIYEEAFEDASSFMTSPMHTAKDSLDSPLFNDAISQRSESPSCYYSDSDDSLWFPIDEQLNEQPRQQDPLGDIHDSPISPPSIRWSRLGIVDGEDDSADPQPTYFQSGPDQSSGVCHVFLPCSREPKQQMPGTLATPLQVTTNIRGKTKGDDSRAGGRRSSFFSPRNWFSTGKFFMTAGTS